MQAVRETAVLRDMVQVVNVDVRRLAHRNATAWAEAPDSRGVCVLVVVVHRMRLAHVRGRVCATLRPREPSHPGQRDRLRLPGAGSPPCAGSARPWGGQRCSGIAVNTAPGRAWLTLTAALTARPREPRRTAAIEIIRMENMFLDSIRKEPH